MSTKGDSQMKQKEPRPRCFWRIGKCMKNTYVDFEKNHWNLPFQKMFIKRFKIESNVNIQSALVEKGCIKCYNVEVTT